MIGRDELAGMSEEDVLVAAGVRADRIRDDEADLLRLAYQMAVINSAERLDPSSADKPGREKARHYGGDGTPQVTEFAAAAFGARIGMTTFAAGQLLADALDLHHRSPRLWARVEAGEVRASYARFVVRQTRHLPAEEAAYVDAAVVESADGRIPWSRFETLVEASIAKANPEVAREKEERAAKATFAKKLRAEAHGMASYLVRGPVPVIEQIAATSQPGSGITRLEGHGPVTDAWVRDALGPSCRFKIQPVLDLEGLAPVGAYEIPDRHRQAVHLMTPADTFPYGSNLSRRMQVDHTIPHDQGGASGVGNYGPMTVTHHRIKTPSNWDVKQPFPGMYVWRDPRLRADGRAAA